MKLSIIIALYNTEKYIEKCIRSVTGQNLSFEDYEIIVINDGSNDRSQEIVEKLMLEFSTIHLINKENGGQSSARNFGFKKAKGDYIFCLDSDDTIAADSLAILLQKAYSNNLDMLSFFFETISEDGIILPSKRDNYKEENVMTGAIFMNKFVVSGTMWRYFFKRSLFFNHNLSLIEGIFHEDEEFIIQALSYSERVQYFKYKFYIYLVRENSTVNNKSVEHRLKLLRDIITVVESLNKRLAQLDSQNDRLLYTGIAKKKEQLLVSICLRLVKENYTIHEIQGIIDLMKCRCLYPLVVTHSTLKFKIISRFLNRKEFLFCMSKII